MSELLERFQPDGSWLLWIGIFVLGFVVTLVVLPVIVINLRSDHFVRPEPPPGGWRRRHPVLRWTLRIVKNVVGAVFVIAGIAMLVLPGQGLLAIFIGLTLLDFPGKRRLELRLVRQRPVLAALNWIRAKANRPPLEIPSS